MAGLIIDSGEPIVLRGAPREGVDAYLAIPMICVGPECPCTDLGLQIEAVRAVGNAVDRTGERVAYVSASSDGSVSGIAGAPEQSLEEVERDWLLEQLRAPAVGERLRERWRRVRGQCGDPAYPLPTPPEPSDGKVPFAELFPYDFNLIIAHAARSYLAMDYYCIDPACGCKELLVDFIDISLDSPDGGGPTLSARAHTSRLARPEVDEGGSLTAQLWAAMLRRHGARALRARHDRARARGRVSATRPVATPQKTPRNASCPCGSGKKYKRCCG